MMTARKDNAKTKENDDRRAPLVLHTSTKIGVTYPSSVLHIHDFVGR